MNRTKFDIYRIKDIQQYEKMLQKYKFFVTFNKFCNKCAIIKKKIYIQ